MLVLFQNVPIKDTVAEKNLTLLVRVAERTFHEPIEMMVLANKNK
jgi:hypothetical protein